MKAKRFETTVVCLFMCLGLLIATYWIARYGGWSGEGDGTRLTLAGEGIVHEGRLVTERWNYANGYGYPALLAFLSQVTSLPVQDLQIAGSAWLAIIVLVAYLAFRELLGNVKLAAVAVFLLMLQPDFLFYILRNSHERTTWTFGLLVLWLWVRSGRVRTPASIAASVCAVYLVLWAMINNNAYLGSSIITTFVIAIAASYLLSVISPWLFPKINGLLVDRRIGFFPLVGFALVFIFISYTYRPAEGYYRTLSSLTLRTTSFIAGVQPASEPYRYVATAWRSNAIYFTLTGVQWSIVLASGFAWLRDAVALIRQGNQALSRSRLILWLFYLGYAAQLALGFTADFAGWLAVNTQVRLFTPFALVTSPMAATWLLGPLARRVSARPAVRLVALPLGCFAIMLALLKMTNDPSVGNQWLFYSPSEQLGTNWVDANLHDRDVWLDTSSHQLEVLYYRKGYSWTPANSYRAGVADQTVSHVMLSKQTQFKANRSSLPLPEIVDHNSIYDNGDVRFYQRRPLTPYQH